MMVANATGCSSIYGGSAPATPYCKNYRSGFGPAWANSLFEDNAEFGLGMATATRQMRDRVERIMKEGLGCDCCSAEIKALFTEWIENRENTLRTKEIADKLIPLMEACGSLFSASAIEEPPALLHICKQLLELRHSLVKKGAAEDERRASSLASPSCSSVVEDSQWIFGGDGWGEETSSGCFDSEAENKNIGFGGLDHVLASGEDVCRRLRTPLNKSNAVSNVVVVDTEVYSNTGGQSSNEQNFQWTLPHQARQPKHCPAGAVSHASKVHWTSDPTSGKKIRKTVTEVESRASSLALPRCSNVTESKDLGMIAKSYGYVYVAQVAMGASQAQYFKAIKEAEAYPGPSLIICYAPCINHGIKIGIGHSQMEEKIAVDFGYWHLWRFNPAEEEEGKNGFHLDSKEPNWADFQKFIMGEVRYNSLVKTFPEEAKELFAKTEQFAKLRYEGYKKLSEGK